jgi:hypothetical protein
MVYLMSLSGQIYSPYTFRGYDGAVQPVTIYVSRMVQTLRGLFTDRSLGSHSRGSNDDSKSTKRSVLSVDHRCCSGDHHGVRHG